MTGADEGKAVSVRQAFKERSVEASRLAHRQRMADESRSQAGTYLGDLVLGGIDGLVTTFAIVAGVEGAELSTGVVLVLGIANLLADGFSMAVGNYLGAKSESEYHRSEREREAWEVDNLPDQETEEIRAIFAAKGFDGELLDSVVEHITADKQLWVETMMRDELNIIEDTRSPAVAGLMTFISFLVFGSIPLSVYLFGYVGEITDPRELFVYCVSASGVGLFLVGSMRSMLTFNSHLRSGLEIVLLGGLAGGVSYLVGYLLKGLV